MIESRNAAKIGMTTFQIINLAMRCFSMMNENLRLCVCWISMLALGVGLAASFAGESTKAPAARLSDQVDDYHGVKVADPFRWLEDVDSAETRSWIEAENRLTNAFLEQIPARPKLRQRLTELWDYEKYGVARFWLYTNLAACLSSTSVVESPADCGGAFIAVCNT